MTFDETTLIEIQDYINQLDEKVGLKPETMEDVRSAIAKHRSDLQKIAAYTPITGDQIDNLKLGDKLIFIRNGGVLSANVGNVFTFANWCHPLERDYWRSVELQRMGNFDHSFCIYDTALFDEKVHAEFVLMTEERLKADYSEFVTKYGR